MSSFLIGEPELNIWLCLCHVCVCVCVMCVVSPGWMRAMLWLVNKTTVQSQSVCTGVLYKRTQSCGHNIIMNRPGLLVWASTLHGSQTMAILWPAFFSVPHETYWVLVKFYVMKINDFRMQEKTNQEMRIASKLQLLLLRKDIYSALWATRCRFHKKNSFSRILTFLYSFFPAISGKYNDISGSNVKILNSN